MNSALAQMTRHLRRLRGMTQVLLAEKAQLNYRHLQKIESGQVDLKFSTAQHLSKPLSVPACYLLQEPFNDKLIRIGMGCPIEILRHLNIGIQVCDLDGTVVYENDHHLTQQIHPSIREIQPRKGWFNLYDEREKEGWPERFADIVRSQPTPSYHRRVLRGPDGQPLRVLVHWHYLVGEQGRPLGVIQLYLPDNSL